MFLLGILIKRGVTVSDLEDESIDGLIGSISEFVVERLVAHVLA